MADPGPPPDPAPRIPFRRRTRAIAWAKVLLPLGALALLSTMFLLARQPGEPGEIPFARIEEIARDARIDQPRLAGVAADGTTVALSAERLIPLRGRADMYALDAPRLDTGGPGGSTSLWARTGEVDGPARRLRLTGGVRVEGSAGLVVEAPEASADLAAGTAEAGPVTARAAFGEIEAGRMTLTRPDGKSAQLVFNEGVRLLYLPQDPSAEAPE